MQIIDANVVIRYLLQDNESLSQKATQIIENNNDIYIVNELIAEVIYVLMKVYGLPKQRIVEALQLMFTKKLLKHTQQPLIDKGLQIYFDNNMDFVDCLLIAYHEVFEFGVISFDKKVNNKIL